ncbi:MAG TPA: hypothetical protein VIC28_08700 [Thermoanaerobaculia bacterium]|jgi:hypothetical protein
MRLNYWPYSFPLLEAECPCDVHFVQYLAERKIRGKAIFHFGTGEHHLVGFNNARRRPHNRNEVLAVTASPEEHAAYVERVIRNAELAKQYKVLFADIYTFTPRLLPRFDLVTLFHLCEFFDPVRSGYAPLDDAGLLELFLGKLNAGGRLFFYRGSMSFDQARPIIEDFVRRGRLWWREDFKTLAVYGAEPPSGTQEEDVLRGPA